MRYMNPIQNKRGRPPAAPFEKANQVMNEGSPPKRVKTVVPFTLEPPPILEKKSSLDTAETEAETEAGGSVAHLRGWLDDFGKKNRQHYEKNSTAPDATVLEKPVRPKVHRSNSTTTTTTPVTNTTAANNLVKRMMTKETPAKTTTTTTKAKVHNANTDTVITTAVRGTPVRVCIKQVTENVQATNEGYASVAKLSKWLADDPTSTKKIKQLRRGANIVAKSRTFDKDLANAVVEVDSTLAHRKNMLKQSLGTTTDNDPAETTEKVGDVEAVDDETVMTLPTPDWKLLGKADAGSTISVSDKKKWLSNAFQKHDNSLLVAKNARTDIVTDRDRREDFASLAKQKWRSKRTPVKDNNNKPPRNNAGIVEKKSVVTAQNNNYIKENSHINNKMTSNNTVVKCSNHQVPTNISIPIVDSNTRDYPSISPSLDTSNITTSKSWGDKNKDNIPSNISFPTEDSSHSDSKSDNSQSSETVINTERKYSFQNEHTTSSSTTDFRQVGGMIIQPSKSNVSSITGRSVSTAKENNPGAGETSSILTTIKKNDNKESDRPPTNISFPSITEQEAAPTKFDKKNPSSVAAPVVTKPLVDDHHHQTIVEDTTPLGFRKAREILVQRSKANGNAVNVMSKVKLRASKFEMMEKQSSRRRLSTHGLLRSSWEEDKNVGYVKKYREDHAPKKSFAELP